MMDKQCPPKPGGLPGQEHRLSRLRDNMSLLKCFAEQPEPKSRSGKWYVVSGKSNQHSSTIGNNGEQKRKEKKPDQTTEVPNWYLELYRHDLGKHLHPMRERTGKKSQWHYDYRKFESPLSDSRTHRHNQKTESVDCREEEQEKQKWRRPESI